MARLSIFQRPGTGVTALLLLAACTADTTAPFGLSLSVVSGDGQQGVVGTTLARPLVVQAVDARGRPLRFVDVRFLVTSGGGGLAGGTVTTDSHGDAQDVWTLGTSTADSQRVEARLVSSGELLGTFRATALADQAVSIVLSAGDSQSAARLTPVPVAPAVLLRDRYGNPVPGVPVTFTAIFGGGSVTGSPATSGSNGVATVGRWTLGPAVGSNMLLAEVNGPYLVVFNATSTLDSGARMTLYAGNNQTTPVGTAVPIPPAVRVTDATGTPIAGVRPSFVHVLGGGGMIGSMPTSDTNGVAAVGSWSLCCTRGTYILRASVAAVADTVYFTATGAAAAPATLTVRAGDGQSAPTGTPVTISPAVVVRDAFGNAVPDVAVQFAATAGGGSVTGSPAMTTDSGVATVGSWTLGPTSGVNTLTATVSGLGASAAFTATGTIHTASRTLSTVTASPDTIVASTGANVTTITVTARDDNGVPISGATATISVLGYGVLFSQPSAPTDADGVATTTLSGTLVSTATVYAGVGSVGLAQPAVVTVIAGPPASVAALRGDNQTAGVSRPVPTPPAVIVRDALGNGVPGVSVTYAVTGGGGTISGTNPAVTNDTGIASVGGWTLGETLGTNTLSATAAGSGIAGNPVTFSATGVSEYWMRVADLPREALFLAAATVDSTLFAIGGEGFDPLGGTQVLATVYAYDPVGNAWAPRTPMPTARSDLALGVVDGVIYAVGGASRSGVLGAVEAYDPRTDTWTTKAPLPTPRMDLAVAVVNGTLYAIGGAPCTQSSLSGSCASYATIVEAYDPATDTWTTKAPMPTPRWMLGATVVDGVIYAVGGQVPGDPSQAPLSTVEAYDPATDTWSAKAPTPTPHASLGVGTLNGLVYAVGGYAQYDISSALESYDPATDRWTTRQPMPANRASFGAATLSGFLYVVAGNGSFTDVEAYHP
jgi:N-acetylneuraminic acid mutarotase